jgi:4-carboxymuconolactone decarboxylase
VNCIWEVGVKVLNNVGALVLVGALSLLLGHDLGKAAAQGAPVKAPAFPADIYPDSGNRLPQPKREDMSDPDRKIFDEIMTALEGGYKSRGEDRAPIRLHSPKLAHAMAQVHRYLKYDTELSPRVVEVAVLTTARELTNQYEFTQWVEHALEEKDPRYLGSKVVDVITNCKPVTGLDEKDAAIITLSRETFGRRKVSPKAFADVRRLFGARGTVDLVELMAMYAATGAELTAFDMQLNAGQKPLLPASATTSCGK